MQQCFHISQPTLSVDRGQKENTSFASAVMDYTATASSSSPVPTKVLPTKAYASPSNGKAFPYPHSVASYESIGILEWVGTLAMASEHGEYVSGSRYPAPICGDQLPLGANVPVPVHKNMEAVTNSFLEEKLAASLSCSGQWSLESVIALRDPHSWSVFGNRFNELSAALQARHNRSNGNDPMVLSSFRTCRQRLEVSLDRLLMLQRQQGHRGIHDAQQLTAQLTTLYEDILFSMKLILTKYSEKQAAVVTPVGATAGSRCANVGKEDANTVLTEWLRNNWINPYPDEQCLEKLAARCGKDVDKIGTWVGNARARKWRPALNQAIALGRPADCLLRDSLAIFEGKPIPGVAYKRMR